MYELIEHKKLDTAASSITFSNIPQIYTDLVVMYSVRSNRSEVFDRAALRFNGSSGTYTDRTLRGSGSGPASTANDISGYGFIGIISAANNTASTFASGQLYIPNYTSSTAKSWSVDCVQEANATLSYQTIIAGLWSGTDPVSEVALTPHVGTAFDQYSSATLYGINRTQAIGRPKAIGGNITYANGYWVHTFTGSGSFYAQEDLEVDALVVAGGGGTGVHIPGGGGGGGFIPTSKNLTAGSYPVLVGSGGPSGSSAGSNQGVQGSDSSALSLTAIGGGYGGTRAINPATGGNGGSGGGGGGGGTGNPVGGGLGIVGQGNNGGNGYVYVDGRAAGGGGGGATSAGGAGSFGVGGNGGAGALWQSNYYAGGGGGSSGNSAGVGGIGGGGNGGIFSAGIPEDGDVNTGGGAGGGENGANGGSGVVIVRYKA